MRIFLQGLVLVFILFSFVTPSYAQTESRRTARQEALHKVCQNRLSGITQRLTRLSSLAEKMLTNFDSKATRVEEYYTNTVVPDGKNVPEYDDLLADIEAKKTNVESALESAKASASAFSCDAEDPKVLLQDYRKNMQAVKSALKDYRTSIKNLVVAVRGVIGQATPIPTQ